LNHKSLFSLGHLAHVAFSFTNLTSPSVVFSPLKAIGLDFYLAGNNFIVGKLSTGKSFGESF